MKSLWIHAVAAVALAWGSLVTPAVAGPISTCNDQSLGALDDNDFVVFGNNFFSPQSFTDCYGFSVDPAVDVLGLTFEMDMAEAFGIDLTSISLHNGTTQIGPSLLLQDDTLNKFNFFGIAPGNYWLVIDGVVGSDAGLASSSAGGQVGYVGVFVTRPVPEPGTLALLGLGLAAAGFARRRRAA